MQLPQTCGCVLYRSKWFVANYTKKNIVTVHSSYTALLWHYIKSTVGWVLDVWFNDHVLGLSSGIANLIMTLVNLVRNNS